MTDWIDITRPLSADTVAYAEAEKFVKTRTRTVERDGYNLTLLRLGAHCGTHLDAPAHYLAGGADVEAVSLETLVGPASICTITDQGLLNGGKGSERLLLKSGPGFRGLSEGQALSIAHSGARLVGTDRLSIAPEEDEAKIHRILLGAGVWILENLMLAGVADGEYELIALPLRILDCEGAPVRALVRRAKA